VRDIGLTGQTVLLVFLFRRVLPLMARLSLMWEYLELGDQSAMAEGRLPEESVMGIAWMVLGSASGEPTIDKGLAPFSVLEPTPDDLLYLGAVSIPPAPRGWGLRLPPGVLPYHWGASSNLSLGGSPSSRAAGKHPCSSSFRAGAPLQKRHSALRLSLSGR
jgi:hypothetical protein